MKTTISQCVALFLLAVSCFKTQATAQTQTVSIDCSSNLGTLKNILGVNNGPNSGTGSNTAALCYDSIGVTDIRTHDYGGPCDYQAYTTGYYTPMTQQFNNAYNPNLTTSYNWANTNNQVQKIIDASALPFFRLGISYPMDTSGGPATPMPKDADGYHFTKFASICAHTVRHFNSGWGNGYNFGVKYWEVWNEPNHIKFWTIDSVQAYYRMYKDVSDSLTALNLPIKIGGPGTAKNAFYTSNSSTLVLDQDYIDQFFAYCQNNNLTLDFYSFHSYDRKNPYHIKLMADTISHYLNQHNFNNTELIVSEANMDEMGNLGYQDSGKGCAYLSSFLMATMGTRIEKVLWYKGINFGPLCGFDSSNSPEIKLNGYAYSFYNHQLENSPIRLTTTGSIPDSNDINSTSNLMVSSSRSVSGDTICVWISNLSSSYTDFSINFTNSSWVNGHIIELSKYQVDGSSYFTLDSNFIWNGNNFTVQNVPSENTVLLKFIDSGVMGTPDLNQEELHVVYNASTESIEVSNNANQSLQIADVTGKILYQKDNCESIETIGANYWSQGIYFVNNGSEVLKVYVSH